MMRQQLHSPSARRDVRGATPAISLAYMQRGYFRLGRLSNQRHCCQYPGQAALLISEQESGQKAKVPTFAAPSA
eukprot:CAMPEP_0115386304 /NCGR_PEP_ID=MMETSP0271-20121206/8072_1 /TAXON_ID=71861 /ORGANISM="Scrippsiella trochoidea, Strain CCMP3099" /LENGTH=73 /DNA_ID=CAMNT_0002809721 /DNA_START=443 /DNA_END=664 /DNA_ORIENTATION=+